MQVQWRLTSKCEGLAKGLAIEDLVPLKHNGRSEAQCVAHITVHCVCGGMYTYTYIRTYVWCGEL